MKCYLVHAYFSGGLDRQIAFNFNIIHVFIERYVFLKKTWGFSKEDWKFVAKARNEKSSGVSYASTWLTDCYSALLSHTKAFLIHQIDC